MHKFKKFIKEQKEIFSFFVFVVIIISVLSITLALVKTNQDTRSRAASGTCTVDQTISLDAVEQEFLRILNAHRESIGKGPLRASNILTKAAQWQAEDMVENNYRSHTDSTGRSADRRIADCGAGSAAIGENIVWSTTSAQNAFDKWMASPGHKANMEDGRFSQIGISRVNEGGTWLWVNTFNSGNDGTSPELEGSTPTVTTTPPIASPTQGQANPTPTVTAQPVEPTSTPPANSKAINFSFKLVGIGPNNAVGENNNPKRPSRNLILISESGEILALTSATYNPATGLFEGKVFLKNEYLQSSAKTLKLILKSFKEHLFSTGSIENNTIPQFSFISGDIDSTNSIDLNDYIDMIACIKNVRCTPDKESLNLNDDNDVDSLDLNILLRSIGQ